MEITLSPDTDLESFIKAKIHEGEFASAEAFALEAMHLYRAMEQQHAELKAELKERLAQLDRGERKPWNVDQFLGAAHERHAATK